MGESRVVWRYLGIATAWVQHNVSDQGFVTDWPRISGQEPHGKRRHDRPKIAPIAAKAAMSVNGSPQMSDERNKRKPEP